MVVNRDEALRCLSIAKNALAAGDRGKAERLAKKSLSLHETPEAAAFLAALASAPSTPAGSTEGLRQRSAPAASSAPASASSSTSSLNGGGSSQREYTPDQEAAVKRARKHDAGDFYAVLGVAKDATDAEIKKAYRKLALVLHPDKNAAPGADEAFKKVSKAFSVLSDPDKRRQFDQYGGDPESRSGGGGGGGGPPGFSGFSGFQQPRGGMRGHPGFAFDGEIDPDEIFRAFFGPGFTFATSGGGGMGGPGSGFFFDSRTQQRTRRAAPQQQQQGTARFSLLQFLPLILLLGFSLVNVFFSGPEMPEFAFHRVRNFNKEVLTQQHKVPFYINEQVWTRFARTYPKFVPTFLENVENAFVNKLAKSCETERASRDAAFRAAYGWGFTPPDHQALERARGMPVPSCSRLQEMGFKVRR
ncbi:Chaperone protein dnaJ [Blastocladiella emersonii ATCC 22665]|nr:Chaperone protein dnaJ [Blastocladiella emersonii ATCC 22665]